MMRRIVLLSERVWLLVIALIGGIGALLYQPLYTLFTPAEIAIQVDGDRQRFISGIYAAMRDPIDWSRPFFFDNVDAPVGTTLFLIDGTPLISLPLRVLHQVFSISIDPAIALGWASLLFFALGCLSMARLAETLGASRRGALLVGLLPLLVPPWTAYISEQITSLSGWFSLVLVIDLLVRIRRDGPSRRRLIALPLLLTIALGTSIYHWLGAGVIVGLLALDWLRSGERRAEGALLIVGLLLSIGPSFLLGASGPLGDGLFGTRNNGGELGLGLGGLLRSGIAGDPLRFGYVEPWGIAITLLTLVTLRRLLKLGPVAIGALGLGLYSLGSFELAGGLLPEALYRSLPFVGVYHGIFRLSTPLVILSLALLPIALRAIRSDRRRAALAGALAILLVGEGFAVTHRGSLSVRLPPLPDEWRRVGALIAAHPATVIDPNPLCYADDTRWALGETSAAERALGLGRVIGHFAALDAAASGGSIDTFDPARPARRCPEIGTAPPLPENALVIAYRSTDPDDLRRLPQATPRLLDPSYLCAQTRAGELFPDHESGARIIDPLLAEAPIRICSRDREAIARYALESALLIVAPGEPW